MTCRYSEYLKNRRTDPEYRRVEKRLRPWFAIGNFFFNIKMRIRLLRNARYDQRNS